MPIKVDDAELKAAYESAESGLNSAMKNAMKSFIQTGSLGDFSAAFKEAVLDGLIEGFLASKAFQETLGKSRLPCRRRGPARKPRRCSRRRG
jgi:hypothetical protein